PEVPIMGIRQLPPAEATGAYASKSSVHPSVHLLPGLAPSGQIGKWCHASERETAARHSEDRVAELGSVSRAKSPVRRIRTYTCAVSGPPHPLRQHCRNRPARSSRKNSQSCLKADQEDLSRGQET